MARVTDDVRVESVVTHHKRLQQTLLLGAAGQRRVVDDGVRSVIVSVVLAAVACAGCVGYAFIANTLATAGTPTLPIASVTPATPSETGR